MNEQLNNFATFKPILLSADSNYKNIQDYYNENNLLPENPFIAKIVSPTLEKSKTVQEEPFIDISRILDQDYEDVVSTGTDTSTTATPKVATTTPQPTTVYRTNPPKNAKDFLARYSKSAEAASKQTGINKDLLLAQIALETGWGKHSPGYNIGGIKADRSWKGKSQSLKTKEQGKNGLYTTYQNFRAYNTPEEGFNDYISFLAKNRRYRPLVGVTDAYQAADIMSKTGYATDKNYKQKLQTIIKMVQSTKV